MKHWLWSLALLGGTAIAQVGPTPNSVAAATATVAQNQLCINIEPFYWEIGDENSTLVSGTSGGITATTSIDIASASKLIYGTFVVQARGSAKRLTANDITFLHFTSGYTYLQDNNNGPQACPKTDNPQTVNGCLAQNPLFTEQNPALIGIFDYDGGHMENHASMFTALGNLVDASLGNSIQKKLGLGTHMVYTEPLLSGGLHGTAADYVTILRGILSGDLKMHDALGIDPVCTLNGGAYPDGICNAGSSPMPELWHFSIGHWVEDDPATNGDGAFSSPGALGFYPWIEAGKQYYGVISRANRPKNSGIQEGYLSAECGRLVRHAWDTGIQQIGTIPQ